jgi:uncharacterized membrane protein YqgA involved in biofilm formation
MRGLGTLINVVAIAAGTGVGLLIGPKVPERMRTTILQTVGLVVVVIGVTQAAGSRNIVFPLVALVVGGIIGELLGLEERVDSLGERIRNRVERNTDPKQRSTFVEGFVAATLLYGVGPLAILGSIDDGLRHDPQLLIVKAALDGLVSIVFASTLGWGVGFSAIPILVYQGALTLGAGAADRVLTTRMVVEMTAAGGVMVMGIGVRLLELKQIRVASLLPALLLAPIGVALFAR